MWILVSLFFRFLRFTWMRNGCQISLHSYHGWVVCIYSPSLNFLLLPINNKIPVAAFSDHIMGLKLKGAGYEKDSKRFDTNKSYSCHYLTVFSEPCLSKSVVWFMALITVHINIYKYKIMKLRYSLLPHLL